MPSFSDPDGHAVTVSGSASQPSFISLTSNSLTISPTCSDVGTTSFDIILSDTNKQSTYTITTTVQKNRPPEYVPTTWVYPSMTIALNSVGT